MKGGDTISKKVADELKGKDITSWLIQNGYPMEVIETWNKSRSWLSSNQNLGNGCNKCHKRNQIITSPSSTQFND